MLVQQRGWNITHIYNLEMDKYDQYALHCAVMDGARVVGYVRGNPTQRPHMLGECFPQLSACVHEENSKVVWEVSRFVFDQTRRHHPELINTLIDSGVGLGERVGADLLVAVVEGWMERAVRRRGYPTRSLGQPIVVGNGRNRPVKAYVSAVSMADVLASRQDVA